LRRAARLVPGAAVAVRTGATHFRPVLDPASRDDGMPVGLHARRVK
jgi:hypothetical protein